MVILTMPPVSSMERLVYVLSTAGQLILIGRLLYTRLAPVYPWFVRFLAFQSIATILLASLDPRTTVYGYVWIPVQFTLSALHYLVIFEIYSMVLDDYPGIRRWGRRFMHLGALACLAIAFASVWADFSASDRQYPILLAVNVFRRGIASSLVLFIGAMMAYLSYFPVPLKRNTSTHAALSGAYFLSEAALVFYRNLAGASQARFISTLLGAFTALIVLGWIFLLSPAGEKKKSAVGWKWSAGDETRVLGRLQSINDTLLAVSRD
jgi:hypothetical protein